MRTTGNLRTLFAGVLAVALAYSPLVAAGEGASSSAKSQFNKLYIVRLTDNPVVAYTGDIAGYAATKPAKGKRSIPTMPKSFAMSATSTPSTATRSRGSADGRFTTTATRTTDSRPS
jgi:hypothetical protein